MPIIWDKTKKRWRYRFRRTINGHRLQASRLLPAGWSRAQADAYDRQETANSYALASGIERAEPLIEDAVGLYLDHVVPHQKDGKKAAQTLAALYPYYQGRRLADLAAVGQEYRKAETTLAPATIRNRLSYLRSACRYAYKEHQLGENMPHLVTPKVSNQRTRYPTRTEVLRIMRKIRHRDSRALLALAFYSGMRWRSEILRARFDGDSLSVGDSKTGTPHSVPLHPKAHVYARRLPLKLNSRSIFKYFRDATKLLELEYLTLHDQRHGTASTLINAGATLAEVGAFLGHTSPQATARYAHIANDTKRRLMGVLAKKVDTRNAA